MLSLHTLKNYIVFYFLSMVISITFLMQYYCYLQKQSPVFVLSKRCSYKFRKIHLCQSLFFNKVAGLRPRTLFKNGLQHKCFPVNFANFLRAPFYIIPPDDCFCNEEELSLFVKLKFSMDDIHIFLICWYKRPFAFCF